MKTKRQKQEKNNKIFSKKNKKILLLTTILSAMMMLNLAIALAQVQSHNLSEVRVIDTNLDMGSYQVNASQMNSSIVFVDQTGTSVYQTGTAIFANSTGTALYAESTGLGIDAYGSFAAISGYSNSGSVLTGFSPSGVGVSVYGSGRQAMLANGTHAVYGTYDSNNYGYVGSSDRGVFGNGTEYGLYGTWNNFGFTDNHAVYGNGPEVTGQINPDYFGALGMVDWNVGPDTYGAYGQYNDSIYGGLGYLDGENNENAGVFSRYEPVTGYLSFLRSETLTGVWYGAYGDAGNYSFGSLVNLFVHGGLGRYDIEKDRFHAVYGKVDLGGSYGVLGYYDNSTGEQLAGYFNGSVNVTGNITSGTGTVFIDGTNSRMGVGKTSLNSELDVLGTIIGNNSGDASTDLLFYEPGILGTGNVGIIGAYNNSVMGVLGMPDKGGALAFNDSLYVELAKSNGRSADFYGGDVYVEERLGIGTEDLDQRLKVKGNVNVTGNITSGTNTVFIDGTNSRVGIGTKSPTSELQVVGDANISGIVYAGKFSSNSPLELATAGTTRIHVDDTTGKVNITDDLHTEGVITAGPDNNALTDSSGNIVSNAIDADSLDFTELSDTMTLDSNLLLETSSKYDLNIDSGALYFDSSEGLLGIGTNSPGATLDVNGDARVGWHGDADQIKLFPADFELNTYAANCNLVDHGGSCALEKDGNVTVNIEVPIGYEASSAVLYGSNTGQSFYVYACDVNLTGCKFLDSQKVGTPVVIKFTSDSTNYISIEYEGKATDKLYGGTISIT